MSARTTATKAGGLAAIHEMARRLGLPAAIDRRLHLLKRHQPYHESDHVLSLAYSALAEGTCLQDLDLLRQDEALLNMLGTRRLPDPTTSGDFVRRFRPDDVEILQAVFNDVRAGVWQRQPTSFRCQAVIDVDGTVAGTTGEKKRGMDFNFHKKLWGYHPLLVSLANTREPLFLVNRPGNVPSHKGSVPYIDAAIELVRPHFERILIRGDSDFSLTKNFDRWDDQGVYFVFAYDAHPNLVSLAESVAPGAWRSLEREPRHRSNTSRERRENVKERLIEEKEWKELALVGEDITELEYRPHACKRPVRLVVLRKKIEERRGQLVLIERYRYFFYVTNDPDLTTIEVVLESNDRCEQENLIDQLKNGARALNSPVHDLVSNWAYMVITALAWTLKAWFGLTLLRRQDRRLVVRMEFRRFLNSIVLIPAQVIRSGRRLVVRLLAYVELVRLVFVSLKATRAIA